MGQPFRAERAAECQALCEQTVDMVIGVAEAIEQDVRGAMIQRIAGMETQGGQTIRMPGMRHQPGPNARRLPSDLIVQPANRLDALQQHRRLRPPPWNGTAPVDCGLRWREALVPGLRARQPFQHTTRHIQRLDDPALQVGRINAMLGVVGAAARAFIAGPPHRPVPRDLDVRPSTIRPPDQEGTAPDRDFWRRMVECRCPSTSGGSVLRRRLR